MKMIFKENPAYLQERIVELEAELEESKKKINYGYGYDDTNAIAILWCIDDVRYVVKDKEMKVKLTDADCMRILRKISSHHDAQWGISWTDIEHWVEELMCEEDYEEN